MIHPLHAEIFHGHHSAANQFLQRLQAKSGPQQAVAAHFLGLSLKRGVIRFVLFVLQEEQERFVIFRPFKQFLMMPGGESGRLIQRRDHADGGLKDRPHKRLFRLPIGLLGDFDIGTMSLEDTHPVQDAQPAVAHFALRLTGYDLVFIDREGDFVGVPAAQGDLDALFGCHCSSLPDRDRWKDRLKTETHKMQTENSLILFHLQFPSHFPGP